MYRQYLATFALCLLPVGVSLSVNYLYLSNTGEFLSLEEIVEKQRTDPEFCLYGPALHENVFAYKLQGYQATKPQVVMVGSSRALNVRERFFTAPFYNAGGGMDSVVYAEHLLSLMAETHEPKLLLVGIDYWWFHPDVNPYRRAKPPMALPSPTVDDLFRPFAWIAEGKMSLGVFLRTAFARPRADSECNIGVGSFEQRDGYAPDGSYYYSSLVTGKQLERLAGFEEEQRHIERGTEKFAHGQDVNPEITQDFIELIQSVQTQGIPVAVILLPLSPTVYEQMQRYPEQYAYVRKLSAALKAGGLNVYDFHDARALGSADCEFWDGTHGGEITFARVLRKIHDSQSDPKLKALFDVKALDETVGRYAGFFMIPDLRATRTPEVDFLRIGCPKDQS